MLEIFDNTPAWRGVRRLHVEGLPRVPRFRQHVVESALRIGPPVWVGDDFDLDNHLAAIPLPKPGSMRDLLDAGRRLDRVELDAT